MSPAAEEAAEEVEGVVLLVVAAPLFLQEPFVSVFVVDLASLGCGEGLIGFGYLDELLVC